MKKTVLSITAFAAIALTLVMLWHGDSPVAVAQSGGSTTIRPTITKITPGNGNLRVHWTYDQAASVPIQGFLVSWKFAGERAGPGTSVESSARQYTITNLTNGQEYDVSVYPKFGFQDVGEASNKVRATPNPRKDLIPGITRITPGNGTLRVLWAYDGANSVPFLGWNIEVIPADNPPGSNVGSRILNRSPASLRDSTIDQLENGKAYKVRLRPRIYDTNERPIGKWSQYVTGTPVAPPGRVTRLEVGQQPSANSFRVGVSFDSVEGADYYLIRWRESGPGNDLNDGVREQESGATEYTRQIEISAIGTYVVRVEACNDSGCGPGSARTVTLTTPPARPTGLAVRQAFDGSLLVDVEFNTAEGATEYKIQWRKSGPGNQLNEGITQTASPGSTTVSAQVTVDEYASWVIRVEACNAAGCSNGSTKGITLTAAPTPTPEPAPQSKPARPTGLAVSQASEGSLQVDVSFDAMDGATEYKIQWRKSGPGNQLNEGITHTPNASSTTVSAQVTVDEYASWVIRVEACNAAGCSNGSTKGITLETPTPPSTRPVVEDVIAGDRQLTAYWTFDQDQTANLTGWKICQFDSYAPMVCHPSIGAAERSYILVGLENGRDYGVLVTPLFYSSQVEGNYGIRVGTPSAEGATVPGVPRDVEVHRDIESSGERNVYSLAWNTPATDGGARVTAYEYRFGAGEWATIPKDRWSVKIPPTSLDPLRSEDVTFEVRAVNRLGKGEVGTYILPALPPAPIIDDVLRRPDDFIAIIQWDAVEGATGYRYNLRRMPNEADKAAGCVGGESVDVCFPWSGWQDVSDYSTSSWLAPGKAGVELTGRRHGRVHHFKVLAVTPQGNTAASETVQFLMVAGDTTFSADE